MNLLVLYLGNREICIIFLKAFFRSTFKKVKQIKYPQDIFGFKKQRIPSHTRKGNFA